MLGSVDNLIWLIGVLLDAAVVVCSLRTRSFWKYFSLNQYMLISLALSAGRFYIYKTVGFASQEYLYFYYYSDALLTISLYFALMGLFGHVFSEMGVSKYVRLAAILLLGGTAVFSYQVIHQSSNMLMTRFVAELSQNMNFVGVVLCYLLWASVMKLQVTRTRLIQFVLALGVYFSAFAAHFALHNLYPNFRWVWQHLPPVMSFWLPLAWAYTFWKIPEEARLVTARLATRPR